MPSPAPAALHQPSPDPGDDPAPHAGARWAARQLAVRANGPVAIGPAAKGPRVPGGWPGDDPWDEDEGDGPPGQGGPGAAGRGGWAVPAPWDWGPLVAQVRERWGAVRLAERYRVASLPVDGHSVQVVEHPISVRPGPLPPAAVARRALLGQLELVHGVGPATAARLRAAGVRSVAALGEVERHRGGAAEVCAEWEAGDLAAVERRLRGRLAGRGHLLATLLAGCVEPSEIAFVDVETLGLAGNTIFLCGIGTLVPEGLAVRQILAPGYADEPALLVRAVAELAGARVLVTYNGRTADVVWLRSRCFFHGLPPVPDRPHLDLVFGTRRRFVRDATVLGDARLPTVQRRLLGTRRPGGDVPSAAVPALYQQAVATGCEGLLVPVLDHNRSDLEALVLLLGRLCDEALAWCG